MKWQLVASVLIQVTGTPIDHKGKKPKYPTIRQAVFHVHRSPSSDGAPDSILRCTCGRTMIYDPAQVTWPLSHHPACWHIEKLYTNKLEGVTLTTLGRSMFFWRYTTMVLTE